MLPIIHSFTPSVTQCHGIVTHCEGMFSCNVMWVNFCVKFVQEVFSHDIVTLLQQCYCYIPGNGSKFQAKFCPVTVTMTWQSVIISDNNNVLTMITMPTSDIVWQWPDKAELWCQWNAMEWQHSLVATGTFFASNRVQMCVCLNDCSAAEQQRSSTPVLIHIV
jgi:hypothetical protein